MTDKRPPSTLYSYSPCGDWLPSCLAGTSLRFSSRLDFNDPFDSHPLYQIDPGVPGTLWLKDKLARVPGLSPGRRILAMQQMRRRSANPRELEQFMTEKLLNNMGILCLTEQWNEPLFWGHYAAKHSGICIGFHSGLDVFQLAEKITYSDELPVIFRPQDTNEVAVRKALLTKSSCWSYENEWRILKTHAGRYVQLDVGKHLDARFFADQRGPGIYEFDPAAIESITMGMNISESLERFVRLTVRNAGHDIPMFKAERHRTMYKIERRQVRI